jgi:sulfite reductase (ferredoxin)
VRRLFDDYRERATEGEYYNDYALRQGKRYFYGLLKELAATDSLTDDDFHDWGQDADYRQEIGVGECAGVSLDVVGAILNDAKEKLRAADRSVEGEAFADAGYYGYTAMITAAKALLLAADVKCNTHIGILNDFATHYGAVFPEVAPFAETVLAIKKNRPEPDFVQRYLAEAGDFVGRAIATREGQLGKTVVAEYYKA